MTVSRGGQWLSEFVQQTACEQHFMLLTNIKGLNHIIEHHDEITLENHANWMSGPTAQLKIMCGPSYEKFAHPCCTLYLFS